MFRPEQGFRTLAATGAERDTVVPIMAAESGRMRIEAAGWPMAAEEQDLRAELAKLKEEHRDLDTAIDALENSPSRDNLQIKRLKKKKLALKDRIAQIEDQLLPDIIA